MHNMSFLKKSNSWTMDETHNYNYEGLTPVGTVCMVISPQIINLQTELNYLN